MNKKNKKRKTFFHARKRKQNKQTFYSFIKGAPLMADLYLLFNHLLTDNQAEQARLELGVQTIHEPPAEVSRCWANIPPEPATIRDILETVFAWIDRSVSAGDFLLVQGDFGACYLVLEHIRSTGIIPVYATTRRQAVEQRLDDNSVQLSHTFRHVRFRIYGQ
jgi:hypothetical protein